MDNEANTQGSSEQVDNGNGGNSVGKSVGIGVGVGVLLLLLIASILYNLYLRFRIKWPGMFGRGGAAAAASGNGVLDAEEGRRCRENSTTKETTQIVPSSSRSPGPYSGGADNRNMRVTPSRALEKKASNSSAVTQSSTTTAPGMEDRKVSKVSTMSVGAEPTVPQHVGQGRRDLQQGMRGTSPSPANPMAPDPIYENVTTGEPHYENFALAQGQAGDYDDELNIYEDIPEFGPSLAPSQ